MNRRPGLGLATLLWLPAAAAAVGVLLPVTYLLLRAGGAGPEFWGLVFHATTGRLLLRTMQLVVGVTVTSAVIAVPLAWLTSCTDLPLRRLWRVLCAVPLAIPSYVGAFTFIGAFGRGGAVQTAFGLDWQLDIYGFPGALTVLTLFTYPYLFLTLRGALASLDPQLIEISRSLGRDRWQTFRRVIIPQLRPALASGGLLVALYTLSDFGAVSMLQYDAFTRVIYIQYQTAFDRTQAAVFGLVLVSMSAVILVLEVSTRARLARYYREASAGATRAVHFPLGRWRGVAVCFCVLVVTLSLGVPLVTAVHWLLRGMASVGPVPIEWAAVKNSFFASAVTAAVASGVGVAVAYLSVRHGGVLGRGIERVTYVGYALPGVVIGLALAFFGANHARVLYQTFPMLVFALSIKLLPQAVGTVRSSLLQINPKLEEAAQSLGRNPLEVLRTVTWPLVRPGVLSGAALVFLTTMKELPITLLLSPTGFSTLATAVWGATEEAFYARAAAPALLLIMVSSLSIVGLLGEQKR